MQLSTQLNYAGDAAAAVAQVKAMESAGLDIVWVAEAYSFDAVSTMGFLAAHTSTVQIASGILPIYTRTPTLTAMTAASLDSLSGGRFILGLGRLRPAGHRGLPRRALRPPARPHPRDHRRLPPGVEARALVHDGTSYKIPLPEGQGTGLGKPLKLINHPLRADIPIYVASLGPKNVEMTAEVADGWMPLFYLPEKAKDVWGADLAAGEAKRCARPRAARGRGRQPARHR